MNTGLVLVSFSLPFVLLECALRTMHAPNVFFDETYDGVGAIGIKSPPGEPFQEADDWDGLMADDYHPTPAGYALAAEVIIDFLAANGYIAEGAPSASSQ